MIAGSRCARCGAGTSSLSRRLWSSTDMPTTMKGTDKQRLRWSRSWWWMLPYVGKYLGGRQILSPIYGVVHSSCLWRRSMASATSCWRPPRARGAVTSRMAASPCWPTCSPMSSCAMHFRRSTLIGRPERHGENEVEAFLLRHRSGGVPEREPVDADPLCRAGESSSRTRWQTRELSAAQVAELSLAHVLTDSRAQPAEAAA